MIPFILMIKLLLSSSAYNTAGTALVPLILIALMLDALIVTIWYFIGSLMNNNAVKGAALGEFYQFVGTAVLVGIIIGSMTAIAGIYYSAVSSTTLMGPTAISTLCTNIESSTSFDMLGKTNSLLSGPTSGSGNFIGICSFVSSGSSGSGSSLTDKLNYPLAATAVVVANLTNQTVANLNYSFTMDAWIGFLQQLSPTVAICIQNPQGPQPCIVPNPIAPPAFDLELAYTPYAGYSILLQNLSLLGSLLNLSVESFIVQMIFISIFLYTWPWLLFGGLVLRSTPFTRNLGGLLLAIALAALFIYPTIFAIEYLSLGNGFNSQTASIASSGSGSASSTSPGFGGTGGVISSLNGGGNTYCNPSSTGYNASYGFCVVTSLPATSSLQSSAGTPSGNYVINFFVEPNIKAEAWAYGCWPNIYGATVSSATPSVVGLFASTSGLLGAEGIDITELTLPVISALSAITSGFSTLVTSSPTLSVFVNCKPQQALNTFFAMLDSYGIIGITSYLLPLINVIITITSIVGLSQLFGGDTTLAGLAKIL